MKRQLCWNWRRASPDYWNLKCGFKEWLMTVSQLKQWHNESYLESTCLQAAIVKPGGKQTPGRSDNKKKKEKNCKKKSVIIWSKKKKNLSTKGVEAQIGVNVTATKKVPRRETKIKTWCLLPCPKIADRRQREMLRCDTYNFFGGGTSSHFFLCFQ